MIFTGTQLTLKRNFYTQTGNFGFSVACAVDNTTGQYKFGISGEQGVIEFLMQSGRIYYQNQFIHTYQSDREFLIEAQFTSGKSNILKDDEPMIFGQPKSSGNFDYFYFTRTSSDLGATFDLYVSGNNLPSYSLSQNGYILSSGQNAVTGYFINQSAFPINVFDSSIQATANYDFGKLKGVISELNTGTFAYTGDFDTIDFSAPILTTFNTSFNDIDILFNIIDARTYNKFIYLTSPTNFSYNSDNQILRDVTWQNYSGGVVVDNYSGDLIFALKYVTGSGAYTNAALATNIAYTGIGYGDFSKSGLITGASIFPATVSGLSGFYEITFQQFSWATGRATGLFSGYATGFATGIGYTGRAVTTFTGIATGFIFDGSGTLIFNTSITGLPDTNTALSLDYQSYTNATGYINISGMSLGSSFYIGSSTSPIVKGVQFVNETGLVYYLSGAPQHLVNGVYDGQVILLTSTIVGTQGNGTPVTEYQCSPGAGFYAYTPFLTGGSDNGVTGLSVVPIGAFTGAPNFMITGSGSYSKFISNTGNGLFTYVRTFTGAWNFETGLSADSLVSLKTTNQYNSDIFSGSGYFLPNSTVVIRITSLSDQVEIDGAQVIISGSEVLNPVNQLIYSPNA